MPVLVHAVDRADVAPLAMSDRFKHDVTYFVTPPGVGSAPPHLADRHYWIEAADARQFYDDGVIRIVSPLDSDNRTELEISEEHERWLEWLLKHDVQHIRLETR